MNVSTIIQAICITIMLSVCVGICGWMLFHMTRDIWTDWRNRRTQKAAMKCMTTTGGMMSSTGVGARLNSSQWQWWQRQLGSNYYTPVTTTTTQPTINTQSLQSILTYAANMRYGALTHSRTILGLTEERFKELDTNGFGPYFERLASLVQAWLDAPTNEGWEKMIAYKDVCKDACQEGKPTKALEGESVLGRLT